MSFHLHPPTSPNHRPVVVAKPGISWARIVGHPTLLPLWSLLSTCKSPTCVSIYHNLWLQARDSMQASLYVKFLGKAFPLDHAKLALADAWRGLGDFSISDLPNEFYFICCESHMMQAKFLLEGP